MASLWLPKAALSVSTDKIERPYFGECSTSQGSKKGRSKLQRKGNLYLFIFAPSMFSQFTLRKYIDKFVQPPLSISRDMATMCWQLLNVFFLSLHHSVLIFSLLSNFTQYTMATHLYKFQILIYLKFLHNSLKLLFPLCINIIKYWTPLNVVGAYNHNWQITFDQ